MRIDADALQCRISQAKSARGLKSGGAVAVPNINCFGSHYSSPPVKLAAAALFIWQAPTGRLMILWDSIIAKLLSQKPIFAPRRFNSLTDPGGLAAGGNLDLG